METGQGIAKMTLAHAWGLLESPSVLKVSVILSKPKNNTGRELAKFSVSEKQQPQ